QITPRIVSPVAAARSRCRRPCPRYMSTGNASSPPANSTVPVTATATGHRASAPTTVHHGRPNNSTRIPVIVAANRIHRSDRRAGRVRTASVADNGALLDRGGLPALHVRPAIDHRHTLAP